jgi:hypothetical protein
VGPLLSLASQYPTMGGAVEIAEQPAQLFVRDQPRPVALRALWEAAARIGAIVSIGLVAKTFEFPAQARLTGAIFVPVPERRGFGAFRRLANVESRGHDGRCADNATRALGSAFDFGRVAFVRKRLSPPAIAAGPPGKIA